MELIVKNNKIDFFNDIDVTLSFDSIANSFTFLYYFNPENSTQRLLSRLGGYDNCQITENGTTLINGTILSHTLNSEPQKKLSSLSGYSVTGILQDCSAPKSAFPLQSDQLTLLQIAQKFCNPFGIGITVDSSVSSAVNSVFDVSKINPSQNIAQYLSGLASQRNIVLTHDNKKNIVFTRAKTSQKPVEYFQTALSMSLGFNGQAMHRNITVMKQADIDGGNAGESSITNPYVIPNRSITYLQNSGTDNETELTARMALGQQLKSIVLTIVVNKWNDSNGNIYKPNTIINVINPELLIFEKTNFFVEKVNFKENSSGKTAVLTCVLPEVYNGASVKNIFKI